ncbi:hypothetical protein HOP62_01925 [Halomonas sp. MCCC 1A17488]|uniref:hypothetical protein n=1 Tax=unclassified Halomonas TaxID=2609666 RepID=UPI0018D20672|nr:MULTISPECIES: hypothetical protein [unclassified Halomonas]MCE8014830.1 hypothetical protein [Halomonas sp. MCCC 1A17488]MCG3238163.1 hypothetical protein [Halomonas sp. MCCC 1A17488]QPP48069.1 hypothetical protein I4484_12475 [Halomonas sp. SS10-MC5]
MANRDMLPDVVQLSPNITITWATPLGGYGHVADEQPLPYICMNGREMTPRFGGEEGPCETSVQTLPLPSGVLHSKLPIKDRIVNVSKRRVNIYWRNGFHSFVDNVRFWFIEQLRFRKVDNGFVGESSLVRFERLFSVDRTCCEIVVSDIIQAKLDMLFKDFHYAHCAELKGLEEDIKIRQDTKPTSEVTLYSSTGEGCLRYTSMDCLNLQKNQKLISTITYRLHNA